MRYPGPRNVALGLPFAWLALLGLLGSLAAPRAFACNAEGEHAGPSRADEAGLRVSTGVTDFGRGHETVEVGIEHRFATDWCLGLGPHVGAFVTLDESFFLYAGTDQRINLGRFWFIDTGTSAGFYEKGDGKDIGGEFEFRTGIAVGRRLRDGSRLSFGFFHMSNSSYYRRNPGMNSLLLRWSR
ncbi:MAG: acyloxyacyl hydrolase [Acidobacteriota bacterium]|nr:acyloxyacyl hydrolase [Acidobacteriota bacterium]